MNRYDERGVSYKKEDVHNAIKNIDKGLYPKSFCKIVKDIDPKYCAVMHADGAGTKSSLSLYLLERNWRYFSLERHSSRFYCYEHR